MFSGSAMLPAHSVLIAGTTPERFISRIADEGFDHVIFLDAVEFGGAPGSVVFLNSEEMVARFPQVSTHKLSLGLLARQVGASGGTKAWLLGVQPQSLRQGAQLSAPVQATLKLLLELLSARSAPVLGRSKQPLPQRTQFHLAAPEDGRTPALAMIGEVLP